MLARTIQHQFVHDGNSVKLCGMLCLSDTARFRSGDCRACMPAELSQVNPPLSSVERIILPFICKSFHFPQKSRRRWPQIPCQVGGPGFLAFPVTFMNNDHG
jgi:hypothetical protein